MIWASAIGDFFTVGIFAVIVFSVVASKLFAGVDEGGEIKNAASERLAEMIERWTK